MDISICSISLNRIPLLYVLDPAWMSLGLFSIVVMTSRRHWLILLEVATRSCVKPRKVDKIRG